MATKKKRTKVRIGSRSRDSLTVRKTPRETGDRVSGIAAKVLRLGAGGRFAVMTIARRTDGTTDVIVQGIDKEVRALAASCLAQDQTKGRRDGRVKR
jgi:hypothetical protein